MEINMKENGKIIIVIINIKISKYVLNLNLDNESNIFKKISIILTKKRYFSKNVLSKKKLKTLKTFKNP